MRAIENGSVPETWCTRRIRLDWLRISRGPWRGPARFVVPPSHGMPVSAMSSPLADSTVGSRMNVATPADRGTTAASIGCGFGFCLVILHKFRQRPPAFGDDARQQPL